MKTKKDVVAGPWQGTGGPKVLLENPDLGVGYAAERFLEDEGFDVAVCDGPDAAVGRRCPLVATGECSLAAEADVIVHSLNPDRPEHAAVLRELRARHPSTPIVVEVPRPSIERHRDLLDGCSLLTFPATRASLTHAVAAATHPTPTPAPARPRRSGVGFAGADAVPTVMVRVVGPVTGAERVYAQEGMVRLLRSAPMPVHVACVELRCETDGGWAHPALAKATIDVESDHLEAHADATTMFVAVDALISRLRRQLTER